MHTQVGLRPHGAACVASGGRISRSIVRAGSPLVGTVARAIGDDLGSGVPPTLQAMTDAYVSTNATSDPDAFDVVANGLSVGRLRLHETEGSRLEAVTPLFFEPQDFDADLDADAARRTAVQWISEHQSDELDEIFD